MLTYRVSKVHINEKHNLFLWCDLITSLGKNLYNASLFRQRQLLTSSRKNDDELTDNEKEVIHEFVTALNLENRNSIRYRPGWMKIEKVMKYHHNPDYYAKGLPRQSAQQILKRSCDDMNSYFLAKAKWKKGNPVPKLPHYKKKNGRSSVLITNQDCTISSDEEGNMYAGLPFAKDKLLKIGQARGRLKQAEVCPNNGSYVIYLTFEVEIPDKAITDSPLRIAAIDFGVENIMAVVNNCGLPNLLYKGGIIKSINQRYNKRIASIMKTEMSKPDCLKSRNGNAYFIPTEESRKITLYRNNSIHDLMHKISKHFIIWCKVNQINTIVAGVNNGNKQEIQLGGVNNQNYVQIPFGYLRNCISYLSDENGIRYVEREESYTSKASFLDGDYIPIYGTDDDMSKFSGKRAPTRYRGMYKKNGFRGLYKSSDDVIINSDLNGAANILRKEYPEAFELGAKPDFSSVIIIRHPDEEKIKENQMKQQYLNKKPSRSKLKRAKKKLKTN